MKKSQKKLLTALKFTFYAILAGTIVFYGSYSFFINKAESLYVSRIKPELSNINNINENTLIFIKGQTINTEKIVSLLPNYIEKLQTSQSSLKKLVVPKKYITDNNNLILGIQNNIDMYKKILQISKNPKNPDLNILLTALQKNKDNCMNYYSLIEIKGIDITLPEESIEFLNSSLLYTEKQILSNKNFQIVYSQSREFLKTFDNEVNNFNKLKKDYIINILKEKNNLNEYEDILNNISKIELTITHIKTNLSNLTVPQNAISIYQSFTKLLDDYESYIQNLKFALNSEYLTYTSGFTNDDSINNLYSSSQKEVKRININYDKFMKIYGEFKNKYNFELFF